MITINLFYCVYPYEYMNDWEEFNEMSLPEKEDFYNHLNMEYITHAGYEHSKRVCKDFEINNLGEYHDLYIQSDTFLLAEIFENFRNMLLAYMNWIRHNFFQLQD